MYGCKRPAVIRILNAAMVCLGVAAGALALCWALLIWQGGTAPGPAPAVSGQEDREEPAAPEDVPAEQSAPADSVSALEAALTEEPADPDRYAALAQAYREAGRDEEAGQVLRDGVAATGDEALEPPLEAVQATLAMPEIQREDLTALMAAFRSDDMDAFSEAFRSWFSHMETARGLPGEVPWGDERGLAWDGSRFWSDYTGTGLLFWGDRVYCGEITENAPDGVGSAVTVDTWYPNGTVNYLRMDAQWENGTATGDFTMRLRCTGTAQFPSEYDVVGTLDGTDAEIISAAQVTIYPDLSGTRHQFRLSIRDGALDPGSFNSSYYGEATVFCSAHTDCGARLFATPEALAICCQNPYPWGRSSPMEDPWMFLNFTYGY